MWFLDGTNRLLRVRHARVGLLLVLAGEILILARFRPFSDFYFPFVWLGYILTLDGALLALRGKSLISAAPRLFAAMFPVSAAFWWTFELLNQSVHNWIYIGAGMWTGIWYVLIASMDFSTVLPAVWLTAMAIDALIQSPNTGAVRKPVPRAVVLSVPPIGLLCVILPAIAPSYAFGLVWVSMLLILDPVNYLLGRPSLLENAWNLDFRLALRFAPAALMCGFFWESWNFWSMPKWIYAVPHVGFWHVFEMPLLGYGGYLPFGLELFAMATFVLPFLGFVPLGLDLTGREEERMAA